MKKTLVVVDRILMSLKSKIKMMKSTQRLFKEGVYPIKFGKLNKKDKKVIEEWLESTNKDIVKGDLITDNIPHREFNIKVY